MPGLLDGKVAVITGGASGIGAATVALFLSEGARVLIADIQDEAGALQEVESGGRAQFVHCDILRETDIQNAIAQAQSTFGGLDIMFNNAGAAGAVSPVADMKAEEWDNTMALLLRAPMLGIKHAAAGMRGNGGGSIITTASIAGLRPGIGPCAYSVAKAATIALTRMAAMELASDNIRVNTICPGFIPTLAFGTMFGISRDLAQTLLPEVAQIFRDAQPLRHSGRPEDIAQTALFLASDASSFTTGQDFIVDGGMMLMGPGSLEFGKAGSVPDQFLQLRNRFLAK